MDEFEAWAEEERRRRASTTPQERRAAAVAKSTTRHLRQTAVKAKRAYNREQNVKEWTRARLRDMGGTCPLTPAELDRYARPQEI